MQKTVDQLIMEYEHMLGERLTWDTLWQRCHDYFDNVGMDINTIKSNGSDPRINVLYDSYSLEAADIFAAGVMNYLTPPASNWFGLRRNKNHKEESQAVKMYFDAAEETIRSTLNKSNFYSVMLEFYKKTGVYGTSILFSEADDQDGIRFFSVPVKSAVISEDSRGRVDRYFIEYKYTAGQAIDRFGFDNVHKNIQDEFKLGTNKNVKHIFIMFIGKNHNRDITSKLNKDKPYEIKWIDKQNKHIVLDSGYDEMPMMTHRFYKSSEDVWGQSPAMKTFMDVKLFNAKIKTGLRAEMKATDPPIAIPDDAFVLPFNANPSAVNMYKDGQLTNKNIFPFGNYGNMKESDVGIERAKERIKSMMFVNVFMAFDGITKQMNNPEVFEKITEKMMILGPAIGTLISSILTPLIERTFNVLLRSGAIPPVPQELIDDASYEITFQSVLANSQKNGELQGLQTGMSLVGGIAQFDPQVFDIFDGDAMAREVWDVVGGPASSIRDPEAVKSIREQRAKQQDMENRAATMASGADIAVKATQASKNVAEAGAI